MSATAQSIFDAAPLGAIIRYSDGTPRPPDRFKRKAQQAFFRLMAAEENDTDPGSCSSPGHVSRSWLDTE